MANPRMLIPSPPDTWPFEPRTGLPPWVRREEVDLGDFGSGWVVVGPTELDLSEPPQALGQVFGRGGVHRRGGIVVRPYRRGGLVRRLTTRTYPDEGRFRMESEVHRALWQEGFPTVKPLGYASRSHAWGVEGLYFTGFVEAVPWPSIFERTQEFLPQFKALLNALSEWGLKAPDLNATNFIIDAQGRLLALDWDRARWVRPGDGVRKAHLRRIGRSLERLEAPLGIRALIATLA